MWLDLSIWSCHSYANNLNGAAGYWILCHCASPVKGGHSRQQMTIFHSCLEVHAVSSASIMMVRTIVVLSCFKTGKIARGRILVVSFPKILCTMVCGLTGMGSLENPPETSAATKGSCKSANGQKVL